MSGIWFPAASFIIAAFLLVLFFSKENVHNEETNLYSYLIILNMVFSTLGIAIYVYAMKVGNLYFTGVIQSFYLVMMVLMLHFMLIYTMLLNKLDKKLERNLKKNIYYYNINNSRLYICTTDGYSNRRRIC